MPAYMDNEVSRRLNLNIKSWCQTVPIWKTDKKAKQRNWKIEDVFLKNLRLEVLWLFHHLLCARWWEKTHLYVIIIKYQNDLRLVSHSNHSSAKFWGPMKFSIIVPFSSSRVGGKGKTFTPTSWFTIRSPYSFGWCYSRVLRLQLPSTCMPHFRSRSYLCTQHDYPLSAPQLLAETESS